MLLWFLSSLRCGRPRRSHQLDVLVERLGSACRVGLHLRRALECVLRTQPQSRGKIGCSSEACNTYCQSSVPCRSAYLWVLLVALERRVSFRLAGHRLDGEAARSRRAAGSQRVQQLQQLATAGKEPAALTARRGSWTERRAIFMPFTASALYHSHKYCLRGAKSASSLDAHGFCCLAFYTA